MRAKNAISKMYLGDAARLAQICNNGLFGGAEMIQPEKLRELDAGELKLMGFDPKALKVLEKYRDILRMYEDRFLLLVIGVENQDNVNYCMPLRHMMYDAIKYEHQRAAIEKGHREKKDLKGAEFTSGFSKTDRLIPVITLAVYWGSEPWDGPKNLHEMLDIPPELLHYKDRIGNYGINLLEVRSIDNLDQYTGELKALLGFVKYQKDKAALAEFVKENEDIFQELSRETVQAIAVLGNAKEVETYLNRSDQEKEAVNMCDALRDMIRDGERVGETRAKVMGINAMIADNLEEGTTELRIAGKLQKHFSLTEKEAMEYIHLYQKQAGS